MEQFESPSLNLAKWFIRTALLLLALGMIFGVTGSLQYVIPGFLKEYLSFEKVRPLHVSSVVFWIILAATGSVFTYLQEHTGKKIFFPTLMRIQLILFAFAISGACVAYALGQFGGREYWEFPPVLAIPIVVGWLLFLVNFIKSLGSIKNQPVYVWMWLTGITFFLFTFLESYLWIFPYFRNNVINDMTIQWKSYGSMVGSWNMLVYGCGIYLMDKITGNKHYSFSRIGFSLYFLGLFNLMFNWGHHIYTLPTHKFVQYISYGVSMTELLILGKIIYDWRSTVSAAKKHFYKYPYRFMVAADGWIFLNLILALMMSVPAINVYTHGTHVTVAHAMGTTIGINTMLLLAFAYDILGQLISERNKPLISYGYWLVNISLLVFWLALISAGITKAFWQMSTPQIPFGSMMLQLRPYFITVMTAGISLTVGFIIVLYPIVKKQPTT